MYSLVLRVIERLWWCDVGGVVSLTVAVTRRDTACTWDTIGNVTVCSMNGWLCSGAPRKHRKHPSQINAAFNRKWIYIYICCLPWLIDRRRCWIGFDWYMDLRNGICELVETASVLFNTIFCVNLRTFYNQYNNQHHTQIDAKYIVVFRVR